MALRKTRPSSKLSVAEKRVAEIVDLMLSLGWGPGSHAVLARRWRCSEANVRKIAAEASRLIKSHTRGDEEHIRERIIGALHVVVNRGIRTPGALQAANKALDTLCKVYGLYAPTEATVRHSVDSMTPEQLAEYEAKLLRDLKEELGGRST